MPAKVDKVNFGQIGPPPNKSRPRLDIIFAMAVLPKPIRRMWRWWSLGSALCRSLGHFAPEGNWFLKFYFHISFSFLSHKLMSQCCQNELGVRRDGVHWPVPCVLHNVYILRSLCAREKEIYVKIFIFTFISISQYWQKQLGVSHFRFHSHFFFFLKF